MARRVAANHVLAWLFDLRNSDDLLWLLWASDRGDRKILTPLRRRNDWILR